LCSYQSLKDRILSFVVDRSIVLIKSFKDIYNAKRNSQLGILFTVEESDIQIAGPHHNGLTKFGVEVVKAMNQSGMIIDFANASKKTALETSSKF
jgi:hypothetical protein